MKDELIGRIGIWGQRHYCYLKNHKPTVVSVMRMKGNLEAYLRDVDRDAQETYDNLIRQYAEIEGIGEELKQSDQMEWARRMNSIRNRVEEFLLEDQIHI